MHLVYTNPKMLHRQRWQETWPASAVAIIAIGQMLLTFIIIGFETWSMILNVKYSFLFVGYDAAFFFTITWISTFTVVCCNRGSQGCATHALVENILSIIASIVLIYFDARFLQNPFICYWPSEMCFDNYWDFAWTSWWNNNNLDILNAKLIAIKVQLSCAACMLALCLLFMVIYIYTSLKVKARSATVEPQTAMELRPYQPPPLPSWSAQPPAWPPSTNF